ncbi:MAG TPA: DUF3455 domain-containing protein [Verrucomicrobiae bacterium]|nr:DUF3455 domain-containing protein [Verrucomicrobiae bacterium]
MRFLPIAVAAAALFALAQSDAPDTLKPPSGQVLAFHVHATGDQIYTCDGSQWTLTAPDAKLFDESNREVGSHFAGPTWQWKADGSKVVGKAVANATPDPQSIPWLLVTAVDHSGAGKMAPITSIQRLHTKGGKAPATGCDAAHKSSTSRSYYEADYNFYRPGK